MRERLTCLAAMLDIVGRLGRTGGAKKPSFSASAWRYAAVPLVMAALYPMSAGACTDLAGSYICNDEGNTYPLRLKQEVQSGKTVYSFDGVDNLQSPLTADGEIHKADDVESVRSSTLKGWCEDSSLKVERRGVFVDDGKEIGKLEMNFVMHLDGDVLVQGRTGFASVGGREISVDATIRCERKLD
jgi:hypothetical protein